MYALNAETQVMSMTSFRQPEAIFQKYLIFKTKNLLQSPVQDADTLNYTSSADQTVGIFLTFLLAIKWTDQRKIKLLEGAHRPPADDCQSSGMAGQNHSVL
jgi:hypothetical protein